MPTTKGPGTRNIFTNIKFASNGKGSLANSSMGQESQKSLRAQFSAASLPGRKNNVTLKPLLQRDCESQLVEMPQDQKVSARREFATAVKPFAAPERSPVLGLGEGRTRS